MEEYAHTALSQTGNAWKGSQSGGVVYWWGLPCLAPSIEPPSPGVSYNPSRMCIRQTLTPFQRIQYDYDISSWYITPPPFYGCAVTLERRDTTVRIYVS